MFAEIRTRLAAMLAAARGRVPVPPPLPRLPRRIVPPGFPDVVALRKEADTKAAAAAAARVEALAAWQRSEDAARAARTARQ
jgi:hypothetical protein